MRDLYARIGVEPDISHEDLGQVLRDHGEGGEAGAVLLDTQRRNAYDHCHATLTAIGNLRHRLKLDIEDAWFDRECPDFVPGGKPQVEAPVIRASETADGPEVIEEVVEVEADSTPVVPILIVIAIGLAVAAWFVLR